MASKYFNINEIEMTMLLCPRCDGVGEIEVPTGTSEHSQKEPCSECQGARVVREIRTYQTVKK